MLFGTTKSLLSNSKVQCEFLISMAVPHLTNTTGLLSGLHHLLVEIGLAVVTV